MANAVLNPAPGSPMTLVAGIAQFSKYRSVVGDPLMPILRSLAPTTNPGSSLWTMKAEMPREPAEGSVTAMTAYHVDCPPLEIQHLAPLRIH